MQLQFLWKVLVREASTLNHCSHTPWPCAPEFVSAALTAPPDLRSTTRSHLAAAASAANGWASCSLDSRPTIAVGASHRVELRSRRKACHSSPSFRSQAKASSSHSSPLRFESAREDSERRGRELEQDGIAWIVFSASSSKRGKSCFSNSTPIAEAGALGRLPHTGRRRIPCSEKAWNFRDRVAPCVGASDLRGISAWDQDGGCKLQLECAHSLELR